MPFPIARKEMFLFLLCLLCSPLRGQEQESVYFGNLHSHTSYSDGVKTPEDAFKYARDKAKIDFLIITDHNHMLSESNYSGSSKSLMAAVAKYTKDGKFVAIAGQEFSTIGSGNHVNVFDIGTILHSANGDYASLLKNELPSLKNSLDAAPFLQFNHPWENRTFASKDYGKDDFPFDEWVKTMDQYVRTIEITNGPAKTTGTDQHPDSANKGESLYLQYLNWGFHVAPTADQDNHKANWGNSTTARTGVIAKQLTRADILQAIEKRHVYATEDKNLKMIFKVNNHLMGDRMSRPDTGDDLDISYQIKDDDEPQAAYAIEMFFGTPGNVAAPPADRVDVIGNQENGKIEGVRLDPSWSYLFFRVTQVSDDSEADYAWTAPVWFDAESPENNTPAISVPQEMSEKCPSGKYVASKKRGIYHCQECSSVKAISLQNRVEGDEAIRGREPHEGCPQ